MKEDKYYESIRNRLIDNEIVKRAKDYSKNRSDLDTYLYVGKKLSEAGKYYGEGIIKKYAEKLSLELNIIYSTRTLYNMREYYIRIFCNPKLQPVAAILSWSHYCELLRIKNIDEIYYYISISAKYNLSKRELIAKIKNKEYERLDEETKLKLINNKEANEVTDYVKNPIIIHNNLD